MIGKGILKQERWLQWFAWFYKIQKIVMGEMKHCYKKFTIEKQGRIINGLLKVN